jgi:four helix bundle protein
MEYLFDHEKLKAYQQAIQFVIWATPLIEKLEKSKAIRDQLDRASISIPLNIAEGNAKFSMKDRCRYLDIADGSAVECAAALDVLVAQKRVKSEEIREGKLILQQIVSLVMGLRNNAQSRIAEDVDQYGVKTQD